MIKAIKAVVHENNTPEQAYKLFEELKEEYKQYKFNIQV